MANFKRGMAGVDAARAQSARGGRKFTPTIYWKAGEKKYIQFITPVDEVPSALMHQFVITGHSPQGKAIYDEFVSRRDPDIDGPDGYDPLMDRFELIPRYRAAMAAVELEPVMKRQGAKNVIEGFEIALTEPKTNADGEVRQYPRIGLIVADPRDFLSVRGEFETDGTDTVSTVFKISCLKEQKGKSYQFIPQKADPVDLDSVDPDHIPSPDDYFDNLADLSRLHEKIDPLPDDFPISRFGGKNANRKDVKDEAPWEGESEIVEADGETQFNELSRRVQSRKKPA